METIFRKVKIKDRLPNKKGNFITNLGILIYYGDSKWGTGISTGQRPNEWLEEIELPNDEEIRKAFDKMPSGIDVDFIDWYTGIKWMRDFVLAGKAVTPINTKPNDC